MSPITFQPYPGLQCADALNTEGLVSLLGERVKLIPEVPQSLHIVPKQINEIMEKKGLDKREVASINPGQNPNQTLFLPTDEQIEEFLMNGQWGEVFIGLVQGIQTPFKITKANIDKIFSWDKEMNVSEMDTLKQSYVSLIKDLLKLPSGIALFRNIIIAYHCLYDLPGVCFGSPLKDNNSCIFPWVYSATDDTESHPASIHIARDSDNAQKHAKGDCVVAYKDNSMKQYKPVKATIPPSLVLAHELGHYLESLIACKKQIDVGGSLQGILAQFIANPDKCNDAALLTSYKPKMLKKVNNQNYYNQFLYKQILNKTVTLNFPPLTTAEFLFMELWNHANFNEIMNILQLDKALPEYDSGYSDGVIIKDAIEKGMKISLTWVEGGTAVTLPADASNIKLVRLGHLDDKKFVNLMNDDSIHNYAVDVHSNRIWNAIADVLKINNEKRIKLKITINTELNEFTISPDSTKKNTMALFLKQVLDKIRDDGMTSEDEFAKCQESITQSEDVKNAMEKALYELDKNNAENIRKKFLILIGEFLDKVL